VTWRVWETCFFSSKRRLLHELNPLISDDFLHFLVRNHTWQGYQYGWRESTRKVFMILSLWFSGCGSLNPLFDQDSNLGLSSFWLLIASWGGWFMLIPHFQTQWKDGWFFLHFGRFEYIFPTCFPDFLARQAEPCDSGRHLSESLSLRLGRVAFPGARAVGCHESKCLPLQAEGDGGPWGTQQCQIHRFYSVIFAILVSF
jgi:hypothetical protein